MMINMCIIGKERENILNDRFRLNACILKLFAPYLFTNNNLFLCCLHFYDGVRVLKLLCVS